jgi:hypothetical protein
MLRPSNSERAARNAEKHRQLDIGEGTGRQQVFNQEGTSDVYTVLGLLVLPRPPGRFREKAEIWEEELKKLDRRNMKGKLNVTSINDSSV